MALGIKAQKEIAARLAEFHCRMPFLPINVGAPGGRPLSHGHWRCQPPDRRLLDHISRVYLIRDIAGFAPTIRRAISFIRTLGFGAGLAAHDAGGKLKARESAVALSIRSRSREPEPMPTSPILLSMDFVIIAGYRRFVTHVAQFAIFISGHRGGRQRRYCPALTLITTTPLTHPFRDTPCRAITFHDSRR